MALLVVTVTRTSELRAILLPKQLPCLPACLSDVLRAFVWVKIHPLLSKSLTPGTYKDQSVVRVVLLYTKFCRNTTM